MALAALGAMRKFLFLLLTLAVIADAFFHRTSDKSNNLKLIQKVNAILSHPMPHLLPLYPAIVSKNNQYLFLFNLTTYLVLLEPGHDVTYWSLRLQQEPYVEILLGFIRYSIKRELVRDPQMDLLIAGALNYDLYPTKGGLSGIYNWSQSILKCQLRLRLLPTKGVNEQFKKSLKYMHYTSAVYIVNWLLRVMDDQCSRGELPKQMSHLNHALLQNNGRFSAIFEDADSVNHNISLLQYRQIFWILVSASVFVAGLFLYFVM